MRVVSPTPIGVEHRYCILGIAAADGSAITFKQLSAHDLRRLQHPSLTCLDASDIRYATDCPSGVFNASHDTVKKALDQICQIRADQVAFGKPCDKSVYRQPAADNIKTVADALKLLCNVTADQIGFKPECDYLVQQQATNVSTALNALCKREGGRADLPVIKEVSWQNDADMSFSVFKSGLRISFSETMIGELLSIDVVVVTWELRSPDDFQPGVSQELRARFLTSQIVPGKVGFDPTVGQLGFAPAIPWGNEDFIRLLEMAGGKIRCRVRLLGRAIFAKTGKRPLDGYVPMMPAGQRVELDFNNPGIGQPSDFESWFYVIVG